MPSCESPARRMTASRLFCWRRSALPTVGVDAEADSDRTEGVLTKDLWKYRDGGQEVKRGWTQGLKDSRTQGLKDSRTQGLKDSRTQGLKDSRTQGLKDSRTQGLKDSGTQGLKKSRGRRPIADS